MDHQELVDHEDVQDRLDPLALRVLTGRRVNVDRLVHQERMVRSAHRECVALEVPWVALECLAFRGLPDHLVNPESRDPWA